MSEREEMSELLVYVGRKGRFHVLDEMFRPVCGEKHRTGSVHVEKATAVSDALEVGATPCNECRWNPEYLEWGRPVAVKEQVTAGELDQEA